MIASAAVCVFVVALSACVARCFYSVAYQLSRKLKTYKNKKTKWSWHGPGQRTVPPGSWGAAASGTFIRGDRDDAAFGGLPIRFLGQSAPTIIYSPTVDGLPQPK
jgi:hypothetical protein